ncbi:MAG: thermonuclease family protein [Burkholderiales bacterium]|nr:thermonuclease family protein [Burkholderiales bacterium]
MPHIKSADQAKDRYGRTVRRVICVGADANAEQLCRGMAEVYSKYVRDQSLYEIDAEARAAQRGLWSDANPTPPWSGGINRPNRANVLGASSEGVPAPGSG